MEEIPLALVDDNPYNTRLAYDKEDIKNLADSITAQGLLTPVMVRKAGNRFQLVYGHRRVRAAKLLNWERIRAEMRSYSDEQMLELSLVENLQRKDLSDYEKGLSFARMNSDFGLSFSDIAQAVGYSKQHICNFARMAELFEAEFLSVFPSVQSDLHKISEHHARLLLQIKNQQTRANTLRLVVSENLSVRDLERIICRFRGWFAPPNLDTETEVEESHTRLGGLDEHQSELDRLKIKNAVMKEFELPKEGNFAAFEKGHAFDRAFSIFGSIPPSRKYSNAAARARERYWFDRVMSRRTAVVRDLDIQIMGDAALATLYLDFYDTPTKRKEWSDRGTVVFVRVGEGWKIVHEHWSHFKEKSNDFRIHEESLQ